MNMFITLHLDALHTVEVNPNTIIKMESYKGGTALYTSAPSSVVRKYNQPSGDVGYYTEVCPYVIYVADPPEYIKGLLQKLEQ